MIDKNTLLAKFGLGPGERLSGGMEAEVYTLGPDRILKIYVGTVSANHLRTLQAFYAAHADADLPYALPRIHTVVEEGPFVVSIETRLPGVPLSQVLPELQDTALEEVMLGYLEALLALGRVAAPPNFTRYKLFDQTGISHRSEGDWNRFHGRLLAVRAAELHPYLSRDLPGYDHKIAHLQHLLDQPYTGPYHLVHGDFFPGNLLVDEAHRITALLDFGLFTMYGDPTFDLATGWAFFDMYDELKVNARARLLAIFLERLGRESRGALYRYLLLFSVYSANIYSPDCQDGHYRWCVDNLRDDVLWDGIV